MNECMYVCVWRNERNHVFIYIYMCMNVCMFVCMYECT